MEPYKGAEPYIFISYASRDRERVTPYLEALADADYRFWYDEGIQVGAVWLETLLEKVDGCAVFCPLFSDAFLDSRFCFFETAWAYHKDKEIAPVYLDELEKKRFRGFYQFFRNWHSLFLYQYADAAQFVERLGREKAFAPCKAPAKWNKDAQIQWRFADGVLTIAKNAALQNWNFGSIPSYQYDPIQNCSTAPWAPFREKILSVTIADDIDEIGNYAFFNCKNLRSVHIPDFITGIGNSAFESCENLTDVRIPYRVSKIGDGAFAFCEKLTDISIPDSVTEIGYGAFHACTNLKNAHIGDGVTTISDRTFYDCERLTNVRIPDGVNEIGERTFAHCYLLTTIRIPNGVTRINAYAFLGCSKLTDVRIPDGVSKIGDGAFYYCKSLTNVRVPDAVNEIGADTFYGCKSLMNVRIPDSVAKIGYAAFYSCASLKNVEISSKTRISRYAFDKKHTHVKRRAAPNQ